MIPAVRTSVSAAWLCCFVALFVPAHAHPLKPLTFVTDRTASAVASVCLSAETRGLVHVRVRSGGFRNLMHGRFQSLELSSKGGKIRGVPTGHVHILANGPFAVRLRKSHGKPAGLTAPLLVSLSGDLPERTLTQALHSKTVTDQLRFLKFQLPGLGEQRLQILEPNVQLVDDKVQIDSFLVTNGASKDTGLKLRIIARPALEKERFIKLYDMKVQSDQIRNPEQFGTFAAQLFNPLVDFGRYDRMTHAIRFDKFEVKNGRVSYVARLLLAPKPAK